MEKKAKRNARKCMILKRKKVKKVYKVIIL